METRDIMNRFALPALLVGFLSVAGAPSRASDSPWAGLAAPVFVHVDARELPEGAVQGVAQDSSGFLWVATQGGLARYDGYHFTNYLPHPSDPKALPDG